MTDKSHEKYNKKMEEYIFSQENKEDFIKQIDINFEKAFEDYDVTKDTRKYSVYRSDIKFGKYCEIDPTRAIWDESVKQDYLNKKIDSIEYRLEECKMEKNETLDISHMNENCFTLLLNNPIFITIKDKIQYLCATNCGLKYLPDLSMMRSLIMLDISNNEITELSNLPTSLEELNVMNNRLKKIENNLPQLKRFNGTNNNISIFNYPEILESAYFKNNPIQYIPQLNYLYYLDISSTNITKIHPFKSLKYLDCSHTMINVVPKANMLEHLLCNESQIKDISALTNLHWIEMINSKIIKIHYMKYLQGLTYHNDNQINISNSYKIFNMKKNKNNINEITFKCS